ncbi:hypothetical protein [Scytonema sp. NUACC21]
MASVLQAWLRLQLLTQALNISAILQFNRTYATGTSDRPTDSSNIPPF